MSKASIIVIISACVLGVAAVAGAVAMAGRLTDAIQSSAVVESDGADSTQIQQDESYSSDAEDDMISKAADEIASKNVEIGDDYNKPSVDEISLPGESVAEGETENIEDGVIEKIITGNSTVNDNDAGEDVKISSGEVSTSKINSEDGEIENRVNDGNSGNNGNDNDVTGDDDSSEDEYEPETVDLNQYDYEAILEADSDTQKKIVQACGSYDEYIKMLNEKESEAEKAGKLKDISGDGKADLSDG